MKYIINNFVCNLFFLNEFIIKISRINFILYWKSLNFLLTNSNNLKCPDINFPSTN